MYNFYYFIAQQNNQYKDMIKQSKKDKADRILIEELLKEMTKDRDSFKEKFLVTYEQLSESENKLIDLRYEYDEQLTIYNAF